jgi:hypothetical protein
MPFVPPVAVSISPERVPSIPRPLLEDDGVLSLQDCDSLADSDLDDLGVFDFGEEIDEPAQSLSEVDRNALAAMLDFVTGL